MHAQSRRRSARALATVTAVALAASSAVALAPSANAFYGSEATVKGAVLSTAKIAAATGWNASASPLGGALTQEGEKAWMNTVSPAALGNGQVAPDSSALVVAASPAARDRAFLEVRGNLGRYATSVATNSPTVYTVHLFTQGDGGPASNTYESVSLRKAGSDGLAIATCRATGTTTTAPATRATCATNLGAAQAGAWAKISPTLVWRSTKAVKAKLLSSAAARKATKAPKGTKTKIVSTKTKSVDQGGRQINRVYKTTGKGVRFSGPALSSITQYGNRTNAAVAYSQSKASDKVFLGKLYDVKSDRYTAYVSMKAGGKSYRLAATVIRYSDAVITATCEGNPKKKPTAASLRTCSKRLAAAELKKAKPLFSKIK